MKKHFYPYPALPVICISVLIFSTGCTNNEVTHKLAKAAEAKAVSENWTCPMHPQVRQNKKGSCPICKMDLVLEIPEAHSHRTPTEDSGETSVPEHAPFHLTKERQQLIGVKTGLVEKREFFKEVRLPGRVAFDPELYTAQTEYLEAREQLGRVRESPLSDVRHSAERMLESAKLRLKILGLSDSQITALGKKDRIDPNLLLHSPGDKVWVYAEVYEMDLPYIVPGLEAEISASFLQGKTLQGKVVSVDRILNAATRTAKVRIAVPSARPQLRPETYVEATIRAPLGKEIAVPFDAVLDTGKEAWVFIAQKDGHFEPRRIGIKLQSGDWIAVAEGLRAGETVVTSANFLIDSESRLRAAQLGSAAPTCPEGQQWNAGMSMCMPEPKNDHRGH